MRKLLLTLLLAQAAGFAQPKNVLYVTHSAGFRHDSLPVSQQVLQEIGTRSDKFVVTATEDLSALDDLNGYDAVVFFTSGELPLSPEQKLKLLTFVRDGGGFAGLHSATDTLYSWPEYGELIGGRFDEHPWTQEVRIDVEDPDHPATRHLAPWFSITDEIYQFRALSRDRVRVLMTLDTTSVDMQTSSVKRTDDDFALAWTQIYGSGRVFYTALGHFDSTWHDQRFQRMVEGAVLWITGQTSADGQPRSPVQTSIAEDGIGNAATMQSAMTISPGSFVSIYGANLTTGATMAADVPSLAYRLAGTRVLVNGKPAPMTYASPGQINFVAPLDVDLSQVAHVVVQAAGSEPRQTDVRLAPVTPGVFIATTSGSVATLWATGLGAVERRGDLDWTTATPRVRVNGAEAKVTFSGLTPGWPGLYVINLEIPGLATGPYKFEVAIP